MKSPRTSPIPLSSIGRISSAKRMYEMGQPAEGNSYLIAGLKDWAVAVGEADMLVLFLASVIPILYCRHRFVVESGRYGTKAIR